MAETGLKPRSTDLCACKRIPEISSYSHRGQAGDLEDIWVHRHDCGGLQTLAKIQCVLPVSFTSFDQVGWGWVEDVDTES